MPGTPKMKQKKSSDEKQSENRDPSKLSGHGVQMQCQICHGYGHNKRGCPKKDDPNPNPPHLNKRRPVSVSK